MDSSRAKEFGVIDKVIYNVSVSCLMCGVLFGPGELMLVLGPDSLAWSGKDHG